MPHLLRRALTVLLVVGLAACTTGPDPVPVGAARPTLTVLLSDDWATAPAVVDAIKDFEAERNVRVSVDVSPFGEIEEYLKADRDGPRTIDVSQWHAFAAGALGWAAPMDDRFAATFEDDLFVPGAMDDVTWGGTIYGVPLDVNAVVMIVNTDLLARTGHTLEDLRTWDGVRQVAQEVRARDAHFTHLASSTWSLYAWLRANGGTWFEFEGDEPVMRFDSLPVQQTMQFLGDLAADDLAETAEAVDNADDAYPLFAAGQTLALTSGTWDVSLLQEEQVDFSWEVVPMPQGPSAQGPGTVLGGSSLHVTDYTDDKALAWDFAAHLVEPEYALRYAKEDGRLPGRTDVLADPFFDDERYRVAVNQLPHAAAMRLIVWPEIFNAATRSIHDILSNPDDVDPVAELRDLQATTTRLVDQGAPPS